MGSSAGERKVRRWRRSPPEDTSGKTSRPYAGLISRAGAFAVDVVTVNVVILAGGALLSFGASLFGDLQPGGLVSVLAGLGWILGLAAYFVIFWTVTGQTLGMRLMALRLVGPNDVPPGVGRSLLRFFGLLLAIVPLFAGFLPILFDSRRRALQDFLTGTVVLRAEPPVTAG